MKKAIKSLMRNCKGAINVVGVLIDVALAVALIPVIKTFISDASNLTATETVLLSLLTLFIIIALVVNIIRQSGLGRK